MRKRAQNEQEVTANQQAAAALLAATFSYLARNEISSKFILQLARRHHAGKIGEARFSGYEKSIRAYESMGSVMSAWFSLPKFLDIDGRPLPLTKDQGPHSVINLLRASRVRISASKAVELMRRSPSVHVDPQGNFTALKRVFFLPDFDVPRAALVIGRYLDTLRKNSSAHRTGTTLLLERNCHVPEVDLTRIAPILREIKGRGTAFMDSVDGDIEAHRLRKPNDKKVGELGVFVFAWTRHPKPKPHRKRKPQSQR